MEGRGNKLRRHRLWSIALTIALAVSLVGLVGLVAPSPALAAGGNLTIEGPGLNIQDPDGDGTPGVTITQYQLRGTQALPAALQQLTGWTYLPQHDELYTTINTWPTKNFYRGKGVKLVDLLRLAGGLNDQATLIKFIASDGFAATFTVRELVYEPRYRYPNFMYDEHGNWSQAGHIIGDASGAVPVEPMIAWKSGSSPYPEDLSDEENLSTADANHLLYGQRAVTQQTNARFAKYTTTIQVLTDPVQKWGNPTADPPPGEVPAGTKVVLHSPFDDEDKVHYTLDGSDPTIHSPMYNWIAKRWWSSREDVLDEINKPIEITQDTTIKAFVTGPGRDDSDIVTFEYTIATVAVTGVSIAEGDQLELQVGQTKQLTAVVEPENATNKNVTWSSSNEAVATVSETGLVTAVSAGTATITVTTQDGNFTDSITVTVVPTTVAVTGVSIAEGEQVELGVAQTLQLTAVVEPANATNKAVTWSSSNAAVATVDQNGLVTAVSAGTATITVTTEDGGYTDSITVTVVPTAVAVTGVSIAEGDQELAVGETKQLTAVVEPENATNKNVTWSSSNESVATVSETGLVTAVGEGEATITVTTEDGGYSASITVTVQRPVYRVTAVQDDAYTVGATPDGVTTMTAKADGFKYFTVNISAEIPHGGNETVVFVHLRNGVQLELNAATADFEQVQGAQAGFNVLVGDVIKVYIVDELSNARNRNPVILQ